MAAHYLVVPEEDRAQFDGWTETRATLSVLASTFTMVTGGNDTITGMLGDSMPLLRRRQRYRRCRGVLAPDLPPALGPAIAPGVRAGQSLPRVSPRAAVGAASGPADA